jgi:arabinoxylan arabinofuranohydrolase
MFKFNGEMYIAYHTQIMEKMMGISGGYRSTAISKVTVAEDGSLPTIPCVDRHSLVQQKYLNPYERVEAETMATMGGLNTTQADETSKACGSGNMALCDIHSGSWLALYGVDFGETGATKFTVAVKAEKCCEGAIQIRLDSLYGEAVGYVEIGEEVCGTEYREVTVDLLKKVTGVHRLTFIFHGEAYEVDYWQFQ